MSLQHYLPETPDSLKRVITLEQYIKTEYGHSSSPFLKPRFPSVFLRFLCLKLVTFLQLLLGRKLLVENTDLELLNYSAPNRRLLTKLLKEGTVTKWECGVRSVDKPATSYCSLTINNVYNRHGMPLLLGKIDGQGASENLDDALTIALAETLERISISEYAPEDLLLQNINELKKTKTPLIGHSCIYPEVDQHFNINWVKGRSLIDNRFVLIPASMVYLSYWRQNSWEPIFSPTTSNGCAAYTDIDTATLKAVYELLERDGFLMYWFNRLPPTKITLDETVPESVRETLASLKSADIDFHLFDCRTEYKVPIMVGVLIDNKTDGVDICAAAGFDIDSLLNKLSEDALRWGVGFVKVKPDETEGTHLVSIDDRAKLWRGGLMRKEIDFFLDGETTSYSEYKKEFEKTKPANPLKKITETFKARREQLYAIDLTNKLARETGLRVVRALSPSLIPMYFEESKRPLNIDRIYTFAKEMGYSDKLMKKEDLNPVPHPFI